MFSKEKTCNSLDRSVRSKPNYLVCWFNWCLFSENGRQINKLKQKQVQTHSAEYFHNNKLISACKLFEFFNRKIQIWWF